MAHCSKEKETLNSNENLSTEQKNEKNHSDCENSGIVTKELDNLSKSPPSSPDILKIRENKHYIRKRKPINFTMADLEMESVDDDPEFDFDDERDIFKKPKVV